MWSVVLLATLGFLAGVLNAIAGGGTFLVYPALIFLGFNPIQANVTSLAGLFPGYYTGARTYWASHPVAKQERKLAIVAAVLGAGLGSLILLHTSVKVFQGFVPWLIILGVLAIAFQPKLTEWLSGRGSHHSGSSKDRMSYFVALLCASIYGAYFSAGVGVLLIAIIGITLTQDLQKANSLKNLVSLCVSAVAFIFFSFSHQISWSSVLVLGPASALGGHFGAKVAMRINPRPFRIAVISVGITIAGILYVL